MKFEVDPEAFRAWLQEHTEHMVGWTCNDKLTPVAGWLRSQYHKEFFVTDESIVMGFFEECLATPRWASQFVCALDADCEGREEPVMGRVALSVFDEIHERKESGIHEKTSNDANCSAN
jgi:hypothetical protein